MPRLQNKVALITGAARGQGRSHAIRLAEEGADIIALDICRDMPTVTYGGATTDDLAETVAAVEDLGRRAVSHQVDIRDLEGLTLAVDAAVGTLGRLDIVCANAGIGLSPAPAQEMSSKVWQDMIDVNLTGSWHTTRATIPHIIDGGRGGAIVLMSSLAGLRAFPNMANYVSAKHGVTGLMRALAVELAPHMIRVNSVHTTTVDTPMVQHEDVYKAFRPDLENPTRDDYKEASTAMNLMPIPWVESIDVSNAVLFLVSDDARYITGVPLPLDAGGTLK
jgi:(+)-trans-carveol dehydrogenase